MLLEEKKSNKRLKTQFNFGRVKLLPDVVYSLRQWLILNASANNAKQYSNIFPKSAAGIGSLLALAGLSLFIKGIKLNSLDLYLFFLTMVDT